MRLTAFAVLAMAGLACVAPARAEDDGFATKSITNMGLTGDKPKSDSFAPSGRAGEGTPSGSAPEAGGTGSFGTPGRGAVGTGPGAPAAGGGSFGAPQRR